MSGDTSRIAITGGHGFLGWHTAVRFRAKHQVSVALVGRDDFADVATLTQVLAGADTIIHLAGVNRADSAEAVEDGNVEIANILAGAIATSGHPVHVVYGNSIQSERDNPYGRGKSRAERILRDAVATVNGTFVDVRLPNIFGEHGRPHYNSFVATFCHTLASEQMPVVEVDSVVPLLHAQDAAEVLAEAAADRRDHQVRPAGAPHAVSDVLATLVEMHDVYARGEIPALRDKFAVDLFNTYRSYLVPHHFPIHPRVHSDARGDLFEAVRSHGGTGMAFVSTTKPGQRRGDHYHLSKIERFFVVSGEAEIALRRLLDDEVIRFKVSGDHPGFVDMPTMWVHNISNVGEKDLVTMFWADQLLDAEHPDQYPERVEQSEVAR